MGRLKASVKPSRPDFRRVFSGFRWVSMGKDAIRMENLRASSSVEELSEVHLDGGGVLGRASLAVERRRDVEAARLHGLAVHAVRHPDDLVRQRVRFHGALLPGRL